MFSSQLKYQTGSDSVINTLLLHLPIVNHSLDIFHEQIVPVAEKLKKVVIIVFTQFEIDKTSNAEISP